MKHYLSEGTLFLIKEMGITQQEIAKKIEELCVTSKIEYTISQQSISRYINGYPFYKEDAEKIIIEAIRLIAGSRNYAVTKKRYRYIKEKEQEREKARLKKEKWQRPEEKKNNIYLSDIVNNRNLRKNLPSQEELDAQAALDDIYEDRRVISFYRSVSKKEQQFILNISESLYLMDAFMVQTLDYMIGIDKENMYKVLYENYLSYGTRDVYRHLGNEFSDNELMGLSKLMYGAAKADENLWSELTDKDLVYKIAYDMDYELEMPNIDLDYDLSKEEVHFLTIFHKCNWLYAEEFIKILATSVFLEKYDWLMLHQTYMFHKLRIVDDLETRNGLNLTKSEADFLDALEAIKYKFA